MSLHTIPSQPQQRPLVREPAPVRQSFALRANNVNQLIDAKCNFVMRSAHLRATADSRPELRERCLILIQVLEDRIEALQEQIDRELKVLLLSLQRGTVSS